MDLARAGREAVEATGDAVVEARADAHDQVGTVHRQIGLVGAVHSRHPQPLRVAGGECTQAHQRRSDRRAGAPRQFAKRHSRACARVDDAAA